MQANELAPATPADNEHARMSLRVRLLLWAAILGAAGYFGWAGDYIVAAVIVVLGLSALSGFRFGAVAIIGSIAALGAAAAYAPSLGVRYESQFTHWVGTTGIINRFLSIGIIGLMITALGTGIVLFFARKALWHRPGLDHANRWLGFGIGLFEGAAISLIFLGGMLVVEPIHRQQMERVDNASPNFASKAIEWTTANTRSSQLGPIVEQYNPFVRFPQLNQLEQVQRSVQLLSDPAKIDRLLKHPSIKRLQERPEVQKAVSNLRDSPEIQGVLMSGRPMDRTMAMALLRHPAILDLCDQPGFLEEANRIIRESQITPN